MKAERVLEEPVEMETPGDGPIMRAPDLERLMSLQQLRGKRVYLAGPMSGIKDFNFPAFHNAASDLRDLGVVVFSPAEEGYGDGDPETGETPTEEEYRKFLATDVEYIVRHAQAVVVLPGWETSRGAKLEVQTANYLRLPVVEWETGRTLYPFEIRKMIDPPPPPRPAPPDNVLRIADRLVDGDRQADYGHPLDDFSKVSNMALALWGRGPQSPEEHAIYMMLVKIARLANSPDQYDSVVDIAGYAKTYEMVLNERELRLLD